MANTTQVTVELPEHESLKASNVTSANESIKIQKAAFKKAASAGVVVAIVIFALCSIVPILQIYAGNRYAGQCPVNRRIPQYLLVAGVITLITIILGIIQTLLVCKVGADMVSSIEDDANFNPSASKMAGPASLICCFLVITSVLVVFLVAWFIAGCYWIITTWNVVQYDNPSQGDYCHQFLYRFAFWTLLLSVVFQISSCSQSHRNKSI